LGEGEVQSATASMLSIREGGRRESARRDARRKR